MGLLLGLFYWLQFCLIEVAWPNEQERPLINAVLILGIGMLIIFSNRRFGQMPKTFGTIKLEKQLTGHSDYKHLWIQLVIPAVILVSGTSLGPEATLVSSTVLFSYWLNDKLRYFSYHFVGISHQPLLKQLRMFFSLSRYLLDNSTRLPNPVTKSTQQRKILRALFFIHGILWFAIVYKVSGQPSLIIRTGISHWQFKAWYVMIPFLIISYLAGYLWRYVMATIKQIINLRVTIPGVRVLLGGITIYVSSLTIPEILFSGQHNFHLFTTGWINHSPQYLVLIALGKLILLTICLNTGWLGGDIFPVLFAATTEGFAVAALVPSLDKIMIVTTISIGFASAVLGSPILVGTLVGVMFAPVNLLPIVVYATIILLMWKHRSRINTQLNYYLDKLRGFIQYKIKIW